MKVYADLAELPALTHTIVTIGSFDGVHPGHCTILQRVAALAKSQNAQSVVVTFYPHPRQVLYPNETPLKLLNTITEKADLLAEQGIDHVVIVPFSPEFYEQTPEAYIRNFLVEKLHPTAIVVGYDHRFGLKRSGDIGLLRAMSSELGFEVIEIPSQEVDNLAVSSTKIRQSVEIQDITAANKLLGRPYSFTGQVVRGLQIGRSIGYPTANINIAETDKLIPPFGIYAVRVTHLKKQHFGMLYIGDRPVLAGQNNTTIEVNIFDFEGDLYGQKLGVEIIDFIRADQPFVSLEALKTQLKRDEIAARKRLNCPAKPKVAVVILNYNTRQQLADFLPIAIQNSSEAQVIVADNGSSDGSVELITTTFRGKVALITLDQNYGFAGGYNHALKDLEADYFILLNSDVVVAENWLTPLIKTMQGDPTIGACQPKIRSQRQPEKFEYAGASGGFLDAWGYPFCRGRIFDAVETDHAQYDQNIACFWATGAAMCIRADLFHALGGFDADYFAHMEEIDLCWRVKRAGYSIQTVPKSVVYHVGGGTLAYQSTRKTYLNFRNALVTQLKNEPNSRLLWLFPWRLILDGVAGLYLGSTQGWAHTRQIIKAHWWVFGNWRSIMLKRTLAKTLVENNRIGPENTDGRTHFSILWQFHGRKKRRFFEL